MTSAFDDRRAGDDDAGSWHTRDPDLARADVVVLYASPVSTTALAPPARPAREGNHDTPGRARASRGGPGRPGSAAPGRRLRGLDGLRAIAVLSVVVFHLRYSLLPGGFLGVDMFFVISGFLITNLLAAEIVSTGRLRLGAFYLRRVRRLLPAELALLLAVWLAAVTVWPDQFPTLRGGVLSSLGNVTNWWLIADHQSYFVSTGRPSMLQHLWSLAIEEQFYLLWSVAVMALAGVLLRTRGSADVARRLRLVIVVALSLAGIVTIAMAVLAAHAHLPYGNTSWVYFGSDTHSMGLFLGSAAGAWLALRRSEQGDRLLARAGRRRSLWLTDLLGVAALVEVGYTFWHVDEYNAGLYQGRFLTFDVVVLLAVLCATRPGSLFARILDIRPMQWVGRRSYSIYIWHWPVCVVTRPGLDVRGPAVLIDTARLLLILGLAALSYRFVEEPIRSGHLAERWRVRADRRRRTSARRGTPGARFATGVSLLAAVGLWIAAEPAAADGPLTGGRPSALVTQPQMSAPPPARTQAPGTTSQPATTRTTPGAAPGAARGAAPGATQTRPAHRTRPTVVGKPALSAYGDSVLLGAGPLLLAHTSVLKLDAIEGRQSWDVLDDVTADARNQRLQPDVLIHLGNNGIISSAQLDGTLRALRDRHRVLVFTDLVPRDWQDRNNRVIDTVGRRFANVRIVDWHSIAAQHAGWLYRDGLHLTANGRVGYTQLVLNSLR